MDIIFQQATIISKELSPLKKRVFKKRPQK
jgi:hypothetical protein